MNEEIFHVPARKCLRCGGILLSNYGLKHGMGHVCKQKFDIEHRPIDKDQITFDSMEVSSVQTEKSAKADTGN